MKMKLFLLLFVLFSAQFVPVKAMDQKSEILKAPVTLEVRLSEAIEKEFQLLVHGKGEVSMLFFPKTSIMTQIDVRGISRVVPAEESDSPAVAYLEMDSRVASITFYSDGEPNQEMDAELVRSTLLSSGIPPAGYTVRFYIDRLGEITKVEGIPEESKPFFMAAMVHYPDRPISVGETWSSEKELPVSIDPSTPPIKCLMIATYTLLAVDNEARTADISVSAEYGRIPGSVSVEDAPEGEKSTGSATTVTGSSSGKVVVCLKSGLIMEANLESKSRISFSEGNHIDSTQSYKSSSKVKKNPDQ